jgi:hypothetical protein
LDRFGSSLGIGFMCTWQIHPIYWIIFFQFGTSSGYAKSWVSFMHLIWFASVWITWNEKNDRFFNGKEKYPLQLVEDIKLLCSWWIKAKFNVLHYSIHNW